MFMNPAEIREFRIRHGLTQRDLGELIGMTSSSVQGWESGRRPTPPTAALIMELVTSGTVAIAAFAADSGSGGRESGCDMGNFFGAADAAVVRRHDPASGHQVYPASGTGGFRGIHEAELGGEVERSADVSFSHWWTSAGLWDEKLSRTTWTGSPA